MDANAWMLDVHEDAFALRHPEDGSEYTAPIFYITATNPATGTRYRHDRSFPSARAFSHEDGGTILDMEEEARGRVERLLSRIRAAQEAGDFSTPVGRPHWSETYPVYGSSAYVAQIPEEIHAERMAG